MKRIAVYIVGHFRNLNETWSQYAAMFANRPEATVDIFLTLWDVRNTTDPTPVTETEVRALCPHAKDVHILPSSPPPDQSGHTAAIAGQLYSLQEGVRRIPDSYDWYIRMRTDLYFFQTDVLDRILSSPLDVDLWIPEKVWYSEPNYPARDVFNDYMWIGTYAATRYLADTYSVLPTLTPTFMEELLARRLRTYPLRIGHFSCLFNLDRRTRGQDMFLVESQELTRRRDQLTYAEQP